MSYRGGKTGVLDDGGKVVPRTDYRCAAHGCPNAGAIDDVDEQHRGKCFFHWREPDVNRWPAITEQIERNFDRLRNWSPR